MPDETDKLRLELYGWEQLRREAQEKVTDYQIYIRDIDLRIDELKDDLAQLERKKDR